MSPHPSTPPPNLQAQASNASLWSSPQFSDYFSDAGDSSVDNLRKGSPVQSRILGRLDAIKRKIVDAELDGGNQTPYLNDFDSELSSLEARLNAPESQTREIAEGGSELFDDDEEDESQVLMEENEGLRQEVRKGRDVIKRVSDLRESLQRQFEEMKNNFTLATTRLTSASAEVESLRSQYEVLKTENASLKDHNARLHSDLHQAIPTIFRLKAHLDMLQTEVSQDLDEEKAHPLEESISQLQNEWADVDRDFEDLYRRYKKNGNGKERNDSVMGGNTPPKVVKGSAEGSEDSEEEERIHRSRIIIKRGGIIRRIEAEPSLSEASDVEEDVAIVAEDEDKDKKEEVPSEESPLQEHGEVAPETAIDNEETKDKSIAKKIMTPWEELWDSIADFAGWHDAYED